MECSTSSCGYGAAARWSHSGVASKLCGLRRVVSWRIGKRRSCVVRCEGGSERSAVIVGAGPAGALLALLLARQDWKVDVFERKAFRGGRFDCGEGGWSLMLGARAALCLEAVGGVKDAVWREGVLCSGRTAIAGGGLKPRYEAYGYEMLAIPQPRLAEVLISSGMREYPGRISYHFEKTLANLHPEECRAAFRGGDGEEDVVRADLVVGADGLHSTVRAELDAKAPGFASSLQSVPAGRHIRLEVPVDVAGEQVDEAGNTHGPSLLVVVRPGKVMWGVPNRDGSMGLTLQGVRGCTAADVASEMQQAFPELSEYFTADAEASARLAAAPERVQGTVTASSYNYKQTVLVGDAAHSLLNVTHLGTGLALEDCVVLDRLLRSERDVASALCRFSEERMPEMAAAAQLCSEVSRTNMFQVDLQRAILRVVTRFVPRIQPWQKAANTQVVSIIELMKWRSREVLIVRIALLFAMVLVLMRAIRFVRLALKVMAPMASVLKR